MPRRRGLRPLPTADRDLAEEVLYLHSLWRGSPSAPAHVSVPATAPFRSRSRRRKAIKRELRRLERGAAEPQDTGSEWHLAPSPPAFPKAWPEPDPSASSAPAKPPQPSPGSLAQRDALRAGEEFFSNRGPIPSRSARRKAIKRKLRRLERGAAEPQDTGSEWHLAPSPPASPKAWPDASASSPAKPTQAPQPSPGSLAQREALRAGEELSSNRSPIPSRSARRKANKRKRRRLERGVAEPQDTGSEWHLAPSPPASPKAWPDASASSYTAKPTQAMPPSPGSLAQREPLRAGEEFFSNGGSDDNDEGSESEGEEEAAAGFFTGVFKRDAALRGYYERGWEEGQFACLACAGTKARSGKGRQFRGCVGLVQHARAATRYGRPGAHRALAAVVCRVLGWDIERFPRIVIDPSGTLGQALAAEATADAQEAKDNDDTEENNGYSSDEDEEKEDVGTGMEDSSTDGDEEASELVISKESAEKEDAAKTGMEDCKSTDGEKEANELEGGEEPVEKEDMEEMGPLNCEDISDEVHCNETVQEVNARKDDSLSQDNNGEVHEQEIAKESVEKENTKDTYLASSKDTWKNEEHCKEAAVQEELSANESKKECTKTADDTKDTAATRLGNNSSMEGNFGENEEEHADKTS